MLLQRLTLVPTRMMSVKMEFLFVSQDQLSHTRVLGHGMVSPLHPPGEARRT